MYPAFLSHFLPNVQIPPHTERPARAERVRLVSLESVTSTAPSGLQSRQRALMALSRERGAPSGIAPPMCTQYVGCQWYKLDKPGLSLAGPSSDYSHLKCSLDYTELKFWSGRPIIVALSCQNKTIFKIIPSHMPPKVPPKMNATPTASDFPP